MKLKGSLRLIVVVIYSLLAAVVGWANRDALYYLDAWVTFVAVAAVPALLITGHALWARAYPDAAARWQKRLGIGFSICMFLAFGWLGINAMFISLDAGATPISDVHKYDFIISRWQDPFTAQFPRPIPADARDVRFHYDPGFLQAATILELGYTTTPARIEALYHTYASHHTLAFAAGTENGYVEPSNAISANDDVDDMGNFSKDYTLYYLDEKPPTEEKDWNHPQSHGVAISKQRCRVVFWAWSG